MMKERQCLDAKNGTEYPKRKEQKALPLLIAGNVGGHEARPIWPPWLQSPIRPPGPEPPDYLDQGKCVLVHTHTPPTEPRAIEAKGAHPFPIALSVRIQKARKSQFLLI